MAARRKSSLLAQGKERRIDGTGWPWRVRLYAPPPGGTGYQVIFKAPAGEGEPWKRVLRRASTEEEARKIFAQAEAALDTEKETPVAADVRASRTIHMLGEEYLKDRRMHHPGPTTSLSPTAGARIAAVLSDGVRHLEGLAVATRENNELEVSLRNEPRQHRVAFAACDPGNRSLT